MRSLIVTASTLIHKIFATFHPRQENEKATAQEQDGYENSSEIEANMGTRTLRGLLIKMLHKLIDALFRQLVVTWKSRSNTRREEIPRSVVQAGRAERANCAWGGPNEVRRSCL